MSWPRVKWAGVDVRANAETARAGPASGRCDP